MDLIGASLVDALVRLAPVVLVLGALGGVGTSFARCAVAELVVHLAARLYTGDPKVRAAKREEWLRHIEDMSPAERPGHAGSLLWLGLRMAPSRLRGWRRRRRLARRQAARIDDLLVYIDEATEPPPRFAVPLPPHLRRG